MKDANTELYKCNELQACEQYMASSHIRHK